VGQGRLDDRARPEVRLHLHRVAGVLQDVPVGIGHDGLLREVRRADHDRRFGCRDRCSRYPHRGGNGERGTSQHQTPETHDGCHPFLRSVALPTTIRRHTKYVNISRRNIADL
jgi:hypothetical protein